MLYVLLCATEMLARFRQRALRSPAHVIVPRAYPPYRMLRPPPAPMHCQTRHLTACAAGACVALGDTSTAPRIDPSRADCDDHVPKVCRNGSLNTDGETRMCQRTNDGIYSARFGWIREQTQMACSSRHVDADGNRLLLAGSRCHVTPAFLRESRGFATWR